MTDEDIITNIARQKNHITVRMGWTELRYVENWISCNMNTAYPNYLLSHPTELQFINVMGVFPTIDQQMISFLESYHSIISNLHGLNPKAVSYAITLDSLFFENIIFKNNIKFKASIYNPFYQKGIFQREIAKKKLCLVTPFPESIKKQLNKLDLLFNDKRFINIDPNNIQFIKCPPHKQISNKNENPYSNWNEALASMLHKLDNIDYDILLTGCGAYSLPLNYKAFLNGKNAINMGGDLQLMFGVVGDRWKSQPDYYQFNEHWISPIDEERPSGYYKIESGAYW